jgi:hypothetical protein
MPRSLDHPGEAHFAEELPCIPSMTAVLRLLGYRTNRTTIGRETEKLLQRVFQEAPAMVRPRGVWTTVVLGEAQGGKTGADRARVLSGAGAVAAAVCTIGSALEKHASRLSRDGELALASVFDAWGSESVEILAQHLQDHIKQHVPGSVTAGNRLSPGYRRWPVEDQAWLFALVPADRIGVGLTAGFMMVPRKSISFVMKLRTKENAR